MKTKRFISLLLALVMVLAMAAPAFAEDEPQYTATVSKGITHGKVTIAPKTNYGYSEGQTLTVQFAPDEGYKLDPDSVVVLSETGEELMTVSDPWKFTMPAQNVIVYAEFVKDEPTGYTLTVGNGFRQYGEVSVKVGDRQYGPEDFNDITGQLIIEGIAENTPILMEFAPVAGYALTEIRDTEGNDYLPSVSNNKLSFNMPAKDLDIKVAFEATATPESGEYKIHCLPSFIAVGRSATINAEYRAPGSNVWHFVMGDSTFSASGNYVTISGMDVTGVNPGVATITGTYTDPGTGEALTATCTVTVVGDIVIDPAACTLLPGETKDLVLKDADTGAVIPTGLDLTVSLSGDDVVTVDTEKCFKVTVKDNAQAGKKAILTATWNGLTATCVVTVGAPDAGEYKIHCLPSFIAVGRSATINAEYRAPGSNVWHFVMSETTLSASGNYVTISGMDVTGVNPGTATITGTYTPEGGETLTATCTVTVVGDIVIDPAACTLLPGETKDLVLKDADTGAVIPTGLDLTVSLSGDDVVTVDTEKCFKVTVKDNAQAGKKAILTANWNGLTATCVVTVAGEEYGAWIRLNGESFIAVGQTTHYYAYYHVAGTDPNTTKIVSVSLSSADAYVSIDGSDVTGLEPGVATLVGTYTVPETGEVLTDDMTVTVVGAIVIDPAACTLLPGASKDLVLKDANTGAAVPTGLNFSAASNATAVATVSTNKEFKVTVAANATAGQQATITATWNGLTADCVVTVAAPETAYAYLVESSASFNDNIRLNFYVSYRIGDQLLQDMPQPVTAIVTCRSDTKEIPLTEGMLTAKGYKISYDLVAKQVEDVVNIRLVDANNNSFPFKSKSGKTDYTEVGKDLTLLQYLDYMLTLSDWSAMGQAAKDYCYAAKHHFTYGEADTYTLSNAVDNVTLNQLDSYAPEKSGSMPEGVSKDYFITAMFESDNSFRMYLTYEGDAVPGDFLYTVDGVTGNDLTEYSYTYHQYYLTFKGVYSNKLGQKHTMIITDSENTGTFTYKASVLTYARSVLMNSNDAKLIALAKALYLYNQAAIDKFGA